MAPRWFDLYQILMLFLPQVYRGIGNFAELRDILSINLPSSHEYHNKYI